MVAVKCVCGFGVLVRTWFDLTEGDISTFSLAGYFVKGILNQPGRNIVLPLVYFHVAFNVARLKPKIYIYSLPLSLESRKKLYSWLGDKSVNRLVKMIYNSDVAGPR